jgi:hypothetical protein
VLAQIEEWGEIALNVKTPTGQNQMKLTYVAYIPGFFTSVEQAPQQALLSVYATRYAVPKPSQDDRKALVVNQQQAHELFGHISQKAVAQLARHVDGIQADQQPEAPQWKECKTCVQAKLHKFVSRQPPRQPAKHPFYQLGIDLVQLRKRTERCYNSNL